MSYQYPEQRDEAGNIVRVGSWGTQNTQLKKILENIFENERALKDDSIARPTTHSHTANVKVATTGNLATLTGLQTIDGIPLTNGEKVLVKDQTDTTQNGPYYARALDWERITPMSLINVIETGAINVGMVYFLNSNDPITVGTTPIVYTTTVGSQGLGAGDGISVADHLVSIVPTGISAGTYNSVTVGPDGRVYTASNPTTVSGYGITDTYTKTEADSMAQGKANTAEANAKAYTYSKSDIDVKDTNALNTAKSYTDTVVANLVDSSPGTLNTLNELAAALGDDPNFATTISNTVGLKAPIASPTFTGNVTMPSTTAIGAVTSTELGYLDGVTSAIQTQINTKAPLASPALTGTPTVPTAAAGTNTTQAASTAFVRAAVTSGATLQTVSNTVNGITSTTTQGAIDELNEKLNYIKEVAKAEYVRTAVMSGVLDYRSEKGPTLNATLNDPLGKIETVSATQYATYPNSFGLQKTNAVVNGASVTIRNSKYTTQSAYTNIINLPTPPTSGMRDDLVFLEVFWVKKAIGDTLYAYGGRDSGTAGTAAVPQTVLEWRIRTVAGVDFATFKEGINDTTNVKANTPANVATAYTYTRNTSDYGLFTTGTGDSASKTALGTADGYVYAIPLFRVKRRNNTGYSTANHNGARDYITFTISGSIYNGSINPVPYTTIAVTVDNSASLRINDTVYRASDSTFIGRIVSIKGTTVGICTSSISWACNINAAMKIGADRPDALYSNIIDARDIIDLRHKVSLTGFNYSQLLENSLDRLLKGEM